MANFAYVILLVVGFILVLANATKQREVNSEPAQIVYKYLPRDLDDYLRSSENQPSVLFQTIFSEPDIRK